MGMGKTNRRGKGNDITLPVDTKNANSVTEITL